MNILIVEDEAPIARDIKFLCESILGDKISSIQICNNLSGAKIFIAENEIDLCFLDLNLNGENGFDLLKSILSEAFHTIIVSAHTERAIEAFEYGVLDFLGKPFSEQRFSEAIKKYFSSSQKNEITTKYLTYKKRGKTHLINILDIQYLKAADNYVNAVKTDGTTVLLNKSMDRLEQILPNPFFRAHRSAMVRTDLIKSFGHKGGGIYEVETTTGAVLPLSRNKYKDLQELF